MDPDNCGQCFASVLDIRRIENVEMGGGIFIPVLFIKPPGDTSRHVRLECLCHGDPASIQLLAHGERHRPRALLKSHVDPDNDDSNGSKDRQKDFYPHRSLSQTK